jgi:K+-transporting ATPase ATPase C chain
MMRELRAATVIFLLLTVVTGVAYPTFVTLVAQVAFPEAASGSLVRIDGRLVGSRLIGQSFSSPEYFWGRPSATAPVPNNGALSAGSNQGPLDPALQAAVGKRVAALRAVDPGNAQAVPVDLVTASASGLDPHISVAAAEYQVPRVARERGWTRELVRQQVRAATAGRTLGVLGEPRVNVLELNLALDDGR